MRDQTSKVYKWENHWAQWNTQGLHLAGARSWVKWACKMFRVKVPLVRALKPSAEASYCQYYDAGGRAEIALLPRHHNVAVALHEAAHAICYTLTGDMGHGPRWLGFYLYLLEKARLAPRAALRRSAEAFGLKYSVHMTPKTMRLRRRKKGPR